MTHVRNPFVTETPTTNPAKPCLDVYVDALFFFYFGYQQIVTWIR